METPQTKTLYFQGTDFSDLLPKIDEIKQKEAAFDSERKIVLCDILYSEEYALLMDIFNALLSTKEYSERSLKVATEVIDIIPAYYTAWCYKLEIILSLKKNLADELLWLDEFTLENPKNYQIWSYRTALLKEYTRENPTADLKDLLKKENVILKLMLQEDSKNHHVWGYKSWLMSFLKLDAWDLNTELAYSDFLIGEDVLNNSALCFRYNIIDHMVAAAGSIGDKRAIFFEESRYAEEKIRVYPDNISSWNYHYRFLELLYQENGGQLNADLVSETVSLYEEFFNSSIYAIEYYCKFLLLTGAEKGKISDMYVLLRDHRDPIRRVYWDYKISQL